MNLFAPRLRHTPKNPFTRLGGFRSMVKHLRRLGIEAILDAVFHATAEGI
jgi:pullulanase/glycogen debranching enzyme